MGVEVGCEKTRHCELMVGVEVGFCDISSWVLFAPLGKANPKNPGHEPVG